MLAYLQIVLGAVLRHVPVDAQPATFTLAVKSTCFSRPSSRFTSLLLAAFVFVSARRRSTACRLSVGASGTCCLPTRARRRHLDREVLGASLGRRLDSPSQRRDSRRRLAADAHHHGPRRHRFAHSRHSVALALYAQRLLADVASPRQVVRGQLEAAV